MDIGTIFRIENRYLTVCAPMLVLSPSSESDEEMQGRYLLNMRQFSTAGLWKRYYPHHKNDENTSDEDCELCSDESVSDENSDGSSAPINAAGVKLSDL